ncbi:RNA methyltransferase [Candidatus Woesearchaeota archaeon]|nr:RNA methyltransferase [Candidatus Woesearchaeota archaeon]
MISIILVEPKEAGNVGAVARVMANFGFENLILVNPKCSHKSETARRRAKHAQKVLDKTKVVKKLPKMDYLIATTSKMGSDYNIKRTPMLPEDLAKKVPRRKKVGIVFGRESDGLTNEEVEACDFVVSIPSSKKYAALNLSHSVSIMLYEFFKQKGKNKITDHFVMASRIEKIIILKYLNKVLDKVTFSTKEKKETQKRVWKRIFSKAMLTKREAFAVIGLLKKLKK